MLGLLYHLLLVTRPDEMTLSRPLQEDAFYSLSVSRSIGHGTGFTIDGVHATNGVQPLVCLLYAPMFTIAGDNTPLALRLVVVLQVLFFAAAALSMAAWWRMLRTEEENADTQFWLLTALLVWNYSLVNWIVNGLETPLALAIVFGAATFYQKKLVETDHHRIRSAFALGCLLGLGVLARIDIAFLVPAILGWHLLQAHRRAGTQSGSARRSAFVATLAEVFVIGGMAVAVSAPWWIYNVTSFGSLLPISGQAQQMLNPDRSENLMASVAVISSAFLMNLHLPMSWHASYWYAGSIWIAILFATIFSIRRIRETFLSTWREWREDHDWSRALPVALFAIALTIYYSFFFGAPHFQFRYLVIDRLLIFGALVTLLLTFYRRLPAGSRGRTGLHLLLALYLLSSAPLFLWSFTVEPEQGGNIFMVPANWIRENVAPGERVGMFQSGTTGFVCDNVENLDGKVNARALAATRAGSLVRYVDSASFDYIIDWDMFTGTIFSDRALRSRYTPVDTLAYDFVVWKRIR